MARAALIGWLSLAALQLAACRGVLGIHEERLPEPDAPPEPECTRTGLSCAGEDVLRSCTGVAQPPIDQACAWGCSSVGEPHCAQLLPSGGAVQPPDLAPNAALVATVLATPVAINADDGSITTVRPAGEGIVNGIGFARRGGVALFSFGGLVIDGAISISGSLPVAFVSTGDVAVNELIDVRGPCTGTAPGPGGWPGGGAFTAATGGGGGGGGAIGVTATTGGGGGGHGARGGKGATGTGSAVGGAGGAVVGDAAISQLHGGWGGGGGGESSSTGTAGVGGGGGGAIQIAANGLVTFGGARGGINAGGCGGKAGQGSAAGGGGGAGGAILVEASIVRISDTARLAANGGGGGGGRDGADGTAGLADTAAAGGGVGGPLGGAGGAGGASGALPGGDGFALTHSGGGGGGTGRIRFNTRRGAIEASAGARISPSLAEPGTTATQGTAATM